MWVMKVAHALVHLNKNYKMLLAGLDAINLLPRPNWPKDRERMDHSLFMLAGPHAYRNNRETHIFIRDLWALCASGRKQEVCEAILTRGGGHAAADLLARNSARNAAPWDNFVCDTILTEREKQMTSWHEYAEIWSKGLSSFSLVCTFVFSRLRNCLHNKIRFLIMHLLSFLFAFNNQHFI